MIDLDGSRTRIRGAQSEARARQNLDKHIMTMYAPAVRRERPKDG